jgi:hypothetical protein
MRRRISTYRLDQGASISFFTFSFSILSGPLSAFFQDAFQHSFRITTECHTLDEQGQADI